MPRQARAEITRQTIIDAGVDLFGDVGYGETDMIDVIDRAGTTKGTCYYYFPTKGTLAAAIVEQANHQIAREMADVWGSDAPAMHRLVTATFRFLALTETEPVVKVGYQLRQAMRQVGEAGAFGRGDTAGVFASALRSAVADGQVRADVNTREAAYALLASLVGVRLLADALGDNPVARLESVWRTLLPTIATDEGLPQLTRFVRSAARKHRPGSAARPR